MPENKGQALNEKIEKFLIKVDELLESHGFQYIGEEDYKYCNDFVEYVEISFEKKDENGKYVDISLIVLLDEDCNIKKVKDIEIDDDNNILSDELYEKIMELYKKFFG